MWTYKNVTIFNVGSAMGITHSERQPTTSTRHTNEPAIMVDNQENVSPKGMLLYFYLITGIFTWKFQIVLIMLLIRCCRFSPKDVAGQPQRSAGK